MARRKPLTQIDSAAVATATGAWPPPRAVDPHLSPGAFASCCARELLQAGWNARIAAARPGGHAEVVAERGGCRVALQCAAEAQAIGYRAVQQAAAARAEGQAAVAAMVSGSGYTAAAQHFAAANHILLLHYQDLPALDRFLAQDAPRLAETG
jgi:restriction system protein